MTKGEREAIDSLMTEFRSFVAQYELDMRGDKNTDDGRVGLVNEIRKIKEYMTRYPSLTYLFATSPFKTTGVIVGVFILLMALYTAGMINLFASILGIKLP